MAQAALSASTFCAPGLLPRKLPWLPWGDVGTRLVRTAAAETPPPERREQPAAECHGWQGSRPAGYQAARVPGRQGSSKDAGLWKPTRTSCGWAVAYV
eukprot:161299-Chlamydomonas_euryale.AAC.5